MFFVIPFICYCCTHTHTWMSKYWYAYMCGCHEDAMTSWLGMMKKIIRVWSKGQTIRISDVLLRQVVQFIVGFKWFQWCLFLLCPILQQTQLLDCCVFFGNVSTRSNHRCLQDWILTDNCHLPWAKHLRWTQGEQRAKGNMCCCWFMLTYDPSILIHVDSYGFWVF